MNDRLMNNDKGFTLIELLIAMGISVILLGAAMYTYTKQDDLLRDENKNLKLRDLARLSLNELAGDIRMAGAGFPPGDSAATRPQRGVTTANATTITFRANTQGVSTYSAFDSFTGTNGFLAPLNSTTDFAVGDTVVFFNTADPADWNTQTIGALTTPVGFLGINYDSITWSAGNNGVAFNPISDSESVMINQYRTIVLTYNAGAQQITRSIDGGAAVPIANQVSSMTFSYFDADGGPLTTLPLAGADLDNVRRVQIMIIIVDDIEPTVTATLMTDVIMRNMGI